VDQTSRLFAEAAGVHWSALARDSEADWRASFVKRQLAGKQGDLASYKSDNDANTAPENSQQIQFLVVPLR
jgi:hypothetical protein